MSVEAQSGSLEFLSVIVSLVVCFSSRFPSSDFREKIRPAYREEDY